MRGPPPSASRSAADTTSERAVRSISSRSKRASRVASHAATGASGPRSWRARRARFADSASIRSSTTGGPSGPGRYGRGAHELRVDDVEAARRDQRRHAAPRRSPLVEEHLQRPAITDDRLRERRDGPDGAERHHLEAHPERRDLVAQRRRRLAGQQRAARDVVPRRQATQVVVGAHLVPAPRRHRQACHQAEHLHVASQRFVDPACGHASAVRPRSYRRRATACAARRSARYVAQPEQVRRAECAQDRCRSGLHRAAPEEVRMLRGELDLRHLDPHALAEEVAQGRRAAGRPRARPARARCARRRPSARASAPDRAGCPASRAGSSSVRAA